VDHARRFPELTTAIARLAPATLVLDGEVAVFDEQLRSRFEWLRAPATADVVQGRSESLLRRRHALLAQGEGAGVDRRR
jgi:ATP-dependent DNA ligase